MFSNYIYIRTYTPRNMHEPEHGGATRKMCLQFPAPRSRRKTRDPILFARMISGCIPTCSRVAFAAALRALFPIDFHTVTDAAAVAANRFAQIADIFISNLQIRPADFCCF